MINIYAEDTLTFAAILVPAEKLPVMIAIA